MTGLLAVAGFAGFVVGLAVGLCLHPGPLGPDVDKDPIDHTVDRHVCQPPYSVHPFGFDDFCFVWGEDHEKHVRPGDAWVCPEDQVTWVVMGGFWRREKEMIE